MGQSRFRHQIHTYILYIPQLQGCPTGLIGWVLLWVFVGGFPSVAYLRLVGCLVLLFCLSYISRFVVTCVLFVIFLRAGVFSLTISSVAMFHTCSWVSTSLWQILHTVKPVCNDHPYKTIYYLWLIQQCVLMKTESTNLLLLTMSAFWSSSRWSLAT